MLTLHSTQRNEREAGQERHVRVKRWRNENTYQAALHVEQYSNTKYTASFFLRVFPHARDDQRKMLGSQRRGSCDFCQVILKQACCCCWSSISFYCTPFTNTNLYLPRATSFPLYFTYTANSLLQPLLKTHTPTLTILLGHKP